MLTPPIGCHTGGSTGGIDTPTGLRAPTKSLEGPQTWLLGKVAQNRGNRRVSFSNTRGRRKKLDVRTPARSRASPSLAYRVTTGYTTLEVQGRLWGKGKGMSGSKGTGTGCSDLEVLGRPVRTCA